MMRKVMLFFFSSCFFISFLRLFELLLSAALTFVFKLHGTKLMKPERMLTDCMLAVFFRVSSVDHTAVNRFHAVPTPTSFRSLRLVQVTQSDICQNPEHNDKQQKCRNILAHSSGHVQFRQDVSTWYGGSIVPTSSIP